MIAIGGTAASAQSPELRIEKSTNGNDADSAPGPTIEAGEVVTWTYEVTVTGGSTMFDLVVSDSSGVNPQCDINNDGAVEDRHVHPGPLNPGQSFFCTATGTAHAEGLFTSTATVVASSFDGTASYQDSDPSYYTTPQAVVVSPGVAIQTLVNGEDANTAPGPRVQEGEEVIWSYVVSNTGNIALSDIQVTNTAGVPVDCGGGSSVIVGPVDPGGSHTCTSAGTAPVAGSGVQQGVGQANAVAIHPQTGELAGEADAQDAAAYTPVVLPGELAFTGPADAIPRIGFMLWSIGVTLWLGGLVLGRRTERMTVVPAAETTNGRHASSEPKTTD
ncbi:MAG: hypothetical protein AAGA65_03580 [Actinomycetota bacterium]